MQYSIMALHTRFQRKQMMEVIGAEAKFVTMLRDPVDMFESAYIYYRMFVKYNMTLGKMFGCLVGDTDTENETRQSTAFLAILIDF